MTQTKLDTDPTVGEIEKLIRSEDDPKTRTLLVILNVMSDALRENTDSTEKLTTKMEKNTDRFEAHEKEEQEVLNQVKGAWRVIVIVTMVVQGLGLYIYNGMRQDMLLFSRAIAENHDTNVAQTVELNHIRKAVDKLDLSSKR